jgi:hypothetical protein
MVLNLKWRSAFDLGGNLNLVAVNEKVLKINTPKTYSIKSLYLKRQQGDSSNLINKQLNTASKQN